MFYVLYEIRNNLNGKIYVGVHKTRDINDGYMGSGKVLQSAIKKYGIENFTKTILEQFENATAMFAREKEVVADEFLLREDTYNLRRGGSGGFDFINKNNLNINGTQLYTKCKTDPDWHHNISSNGGKTAYIRRTGFHDRLKRHSGFVSIQQQLAALTAAASEESILKRKETFKEINHQQGDKNSQFGSMWITNENENKKIKKTDPVPDGWRKGRIINAPVV